MVADQVRQYMPARSSAGASAPRLMPGSFPMPWSRPSTTGVRQRGWGQFIIATGDRDICPFATVNVTPRQVSSLRWAESGTACQMHLPRRSTIPGRMLPHWGHAPSIFSRHSSFADAVHGETSKPSTTPYWNGSTGPTTACRFSWTCGVHGCELIAPTWSFSPAEAAANVYAALETKAMAA